MNLTDTCEFIARQLNDHADCDHGVRQGTYHTWKEAHIKQALDIALSYLYTLKASDFAEVITFNTTKSGTTLDTSAACTKPLKLISVGGDGDNVEVQTEETNDLLGLMSAGCTDGNTSNSTVILRQLSSSVYSGKEVIPAGTPITLLCATPPNIGTVSNEVLTEYQILITSFALWWLLLTDNESRSNQPRWEAYYTAMKDFVEQKLLLEFSLQEDDYILGRRRVND